MCFLRNKIKSCINFCLYLFLKLARNTWLTEMESMANEMAVKKLQLDQTSNAMRPTHKEKCFSSGIQIVKMEGKVALKKRILWRVIKTIMSNFPIYSFSPQFFFLAYQFSLLPVLITQERMDKQTIQGLEKTFPVARRYVVRCFVVLGHFISRNFDILTSFCDIWNF